MYSLHLRLVLSLGASLLLLFVVQTIIIGKEVAALSEQNLLSRLNHDQETILAAIEWQPPSSPKLNSLRVPPIYQRPFSGHYYQITFPSETFYSRSLWDEKLPNIPEAVARDVPGPSGQRLLVASRKVTLHGRVIQIQTAEDITQTEQAAFIFQRHVFMFAVAVTLGLLVLQAWIVRKGLRPLDTIRQQLSLLEKGEVDILDIPTPMEIYPLVDEINRLVQVIRNRMNRSRQSLGNLAHAVKTPLAIITQILQRSPDCVDKHQIKEQLRLIDERVTHELTRARTAGTAPGGRWQDPRKDIMDISRMLETIFPDVQMLLDIPPDLRITADRQDMLEVFGNILENACKWARSTVQCSMVRYENYVDICVEDDGPGVSEAKFPDLIKRGARLDEAKPGHGIGLSIVSEIVTAYQGEVELGRSSNLGGLSLTIRLPQPK
ncbi:MAG: GHKL domain-containing protein [Bacteroidetes bacterium]|nr:MAG: GHKL domain-containing protein [Bacteroidota bacterium]